MLFVNSCAVEACCHFIGGLDALAVRLALWLNIGHQVNHAVHFSRANPRRLTVFFHIIHFRDLIIPSFNALHTDATPVASYLPRDNLTDEGMEAVAAIASIAGIISLVGQTLGQIAKLRGFYQECSEASGSVRRFLKALNGLIQIHEDVRDLMRKLENTTAADANQSILASLQIQINDCGKDVGLWLEKASACQPMAGSGTRATFRKFLVALEQRKIVDIYQEIANHRANITTKLSVVGRHLDISQSTVLEIISTKIDEVAESHKLTAEAFEWREANLFFNNPVDTYDIHSGPASLASIADSLYRIESVLGSRNGSVGSCASFQAITYEREFSRYEVYPSLLAA
ncbi:hypothetical protein B0O99DRAFT_75148 [Bisporella sp. PMI_857]|nr:hypothetical protein B0O99DRAFT_75148 [Bisporella sp. PMI_857]